MDQSKGFRRERHMSVSFLDGRVILHHGDCLDVLATLPEASVDSVVTDPPYHLTSIVKRFANGEPAHGFMGKAWDGGDIAFRPETWAAVARVLKPGGHLLACGGTRTYHRLACAIEDAGFEIRDAIMWHYGSGFPKSLDVSHAIDKAAGAEREKVRVPADQARNPKSINGGKEIEGGDRPWMKEARERGFHEKNGNVPATEAAKQWEGWGTALKPSTEILVVAQKPFSFRQEWSTIVSEVWKLWSRLWLMLPARHAAKYSTLNPSGCGVDPLASAQWSADDASNTQAALCAQMDTPQFASALISSLNTVSSWSGILGASLAEGSTFITETELNTIIDLRILRSCLSKITPEGIIQAHRSGAWSNAHASSVERYSNATASKLRSILELSATESVLRADAIFCEGETVQIAPATEIICMARKPLSEATVAANVLKHGTGGLNIDGCRVDGADNRTFDRMPGERSRDQYRTGTTEVPQPTDLGRWPANLCHDGSEEVLDLFPDADGSKIRDSRGRPHLAFSMDDRPCNAVRDDVHNGYNDSGSAARFFYTAKADANDRLGSKHPTVKPLDLMQWLVRLVTPRGGLVLDCFAGTGPTGEAAWCEGMRAVLIEREPEYCDDIARRMELAVTPTKRRAVAKSKNKLDKPEDLPLFAVQLPLLI